MVPPRHPWARGVQAKRLQAKQAKGGVVATIFGALGFTIISFTCVAPFLGGSVLLTPEILTGVSDSNGTNNYNTSSIGNIYYFPNGTASWSVLDISAYPSGTWANVGSKRPGLPCLTSPPMVPSEYPDAV